MSSKRLHLLNSLKIYWWIREYIEKNGESPTRVEVAIAFSVNIYSVVKATNTLHERGLIAVNPIFDRPYQILREV